MFGHVRKYWLLVNRSPRTRNVNANVSPSIGSFSSHAGGQQTAMIVPMNAYNLRQTMSRIVSGWLSCRETSRRSFWRRWGLAPFDRLPFGSSLNCGHLHSSGCCKLILFTRDDDKLSTKTIVDRFVCWHTCWESMRVLVHHGRYVMSNSLAMSSFVWMCLDPCRSAQTHIFDNLQWNSLRTAYKSIRASLKVPSWSPILSEPQLVRELWGGLVPALHPAGPSNHRSSSISHQPKQPIFRKHDSKVADNNFRLWMTPSGSQLSVWLNCTT